jgi:2-polyprenyl-3-methyl-5-hydroxy-6-metoxy-1,4-benzoquinol methylase
MNKAKQTPFDYQQAQKEATAWFDGYYKEAAKEVGAVAWARGEANPLLQEYLDSVNTATARAIVIGCGLGDDAYALYKAGFDVTAIDISPEAISWAKERFGATAIDFRTEDLFELPQELLGKFDFVFEAFTIQSLPLSLRDRVITAIASLMAPKAKILAVCHAKREDEHYEGPPWPLTTNELRLFTMKECRELEFSIYEEQSNLSTLKVRALFQKQN